MLSGGVEHIQELLSIFKSSSPLMSGGAKPAAGVEETPLGGIEATTGAGAATGVDTTGEGCGIDTGVGVGAATACAGAATPERADPAWATNT